MFPRLNFSLPILLAAFPALLVAASEAALATCDLILAEVRPGNAASSRAFLAAGYARIDDALHDVDGALVPVERYVLRK